MDEGMHSTNKTKRKHPLETSNPISSVLFCWLVPFFIRGLKKSLNEDDMYATRKCDDSGVLGQKVEKIWNRQINKSKNPSLWRCIGTVFKWHIILIGLMPLAAETIRIAQPLLISRLLDRYESTSIPFDKTKASVEGALLVLSSLFHVIFVHNYQMRSLVLGMQVRTAICSLIYRKSLKLNKSAMVETTIGQMVNLLSNDVSRFDYLSQHFHYLWLGPLQISVVMVLLYKYVGISGLVGTIFLILMVPFQIFIGKTVSHLRLKTAVYTDERIRLMNEVISGIQIIKMYTWEKPFKKLIESVRWQELQQIKLTSYIRAIMSSIVILLNRFCIFLCVLTYFVTGNTVTASYAYTVSSFYSIVRNTSGLWFPRALQQLAECITTVRRIQHFLLLPEIDVHDSANSQRTEICLRNVSVKWLPSLPENNLKNITFQASLDQLVVVCGPVGGGKTTLLHTILQEIKAISGEVCVYGKISYASQEPWLFSSSVRQNIIFGQKYNELKYRQVIRVCALERDFTLLPHADQTLVGERGTSLSGGQKARINLARAVYNDADIYLLDDPLSAVDPTVGEHLFKECICGYLKNKCVVLVTHHIQHLKEAHRIYLLENGEITTSGAYKEIKKSGSQFSELFSFCTENEKEVIQWTKKSKNLEMKVNTSDTVVGEREQRITGSIYARVYLRYFQAGGHWCKSIILAILFISCQLFGSLMDCFIDLWVNHQQIKDNRNRNYSSVLKNTDNSVNKIVQLEIFLYESYPIYILSGLIVTHIFFGFVRGIVFYNFSLTASKNMHNGMLDSIIGASVRFFNINPSGRILNRFSKDMGTVDETLPMSLFDTIQLALQVLAIALVTGSLNPWSLLGTLVILIIFYLIRLIYLASSKDIKRIEAVTRSPIYTHLAATLQGLTTIRAFGAQNILKDEFDNYQDKYTSASFLFLSANSTFGFWLDFHCVIYIGLVIISILFIENETYAGNAGLSLTQAMLLTGTFQWGMRQWSELANQMTSVERIQEYLDVPLEHDNFKDNPVKSWPYRGKIVFDSLFLRYSTDEPYILKNLNLTVHPKEKIGIVGRTGAGKSSIIQALFRLVLIDGGILIDNIDIKSIPLKRLRSAISIIPQEPILFSGTLKRNLDPLNEYNDEVLWRVLQEVELKSAVEDLTEGLETKMAESGSNFSVGQRQLICFARALLQKNKILVLDEATANVDPYTDSLIQQTIRKKFKDCTVLTVAHRMHTIIDSDRVLVMDAGIAMEFDHPFVLLQNENGLFYKLVMQTGNAMSRELFNGAEKNYSHLIGTYL